MPLLDFLGDIYSAWQGHQSAKEANRTNIKLSREQRAWEENMANTAIQRRRKDFEDAGFNPVLAATGVGAGTPSVSAPTVEPTFKPEWTKGAGASALLLKEQLLNLRSNTANTAEEARAKKLDTDLREQGKTQEGEARVNRFVEQREWDDLKTEILRNTAKSTGAEAKRQSETVDSMIQIAKQQAKAGKLDVEALENIARLGGIEAGKMQGIIKMILDLLKD